MSFSQNQITAEVGRDLWMSSSPISLFKLGHLEQVAKDHFQTAFEDLHKKESPQAHWATCLNALSCAQ